MQEAQTSAPPTSFASLLTALAAPAHEPAQCWDHDALADDIATISYEKALRTHSRYRKPDAPEPLRFQATTAVDTLAALNAGSQQDRKAASITLRLSQAECAQLRQRAADAGLSVSAYLRSCVFEAEMLRAQVKEALSQFRSAGGANTQEMSKPPQPSPTWRAKLFSRWSRGPRTASA